MHERGTQTGRGRQEQLRRHVLLLLLVVSQNSLKVERLLETCWGSDLRLAPVMWDDKRVGFMVLPLRAPL